MLTDIAYPMLYIYTAGTERFRDILVVVARSNVLVVKLDVHRFVHYPICSSQFYCVKLIIAITYQI